MKKIQNCNLKYALLSNGLVVNFDQIVGVQPNPEKKNEFYVHTTTAQYYKINKADYEYLVTAGLGLTLRDQLESPDAMAPAGER